MTWRHLEPPQDGRPGGALIVLILITINVVVCIIVVMIPFL